MADIAHTTDFSDQSDVAFCHALRLALGAPGRLDILHVHAAGSRDDWSSYPHVRQVLSLWGLLPATASPAEIKDRLGLSVAKIEISDRDPLSGVDHFFSRHRPDVLVVATHGRQGMNRWLHGSISEDLAVRTQVPTLMIGPQSRGFVDPGTGHMKIARLLMPVATKPSPFAGLRSLQGLLSRLALPIGGLELITIGSPMSDVPDFSGQTWPVECLAGDVVEGILQEATRRQADLIVMPTQGRHGFLDALQGSTTSQVLARATCPVLALPAIAA